ncbi:MAG: uracil-DNA glycosylase family protein [Alphaproteobacteria bacterium]|nr:uracil-DNA glycosylase family protein [Alphaproteobacteria bacterium]
MADTLEHVLRQIRSCRVCAAELPNGVRPVLRASATAKLAIVSQAPGIRVHNTGLSFNDPSGVRLRDWLGVSSETFYDESRIAIIPMGFCFPGHDTAGGDRPPRKECAPLWHKRLFEVLPEFQLILLVGSFAITWHLGDRAKRSMSETVAAWREYAPHYLPLPHPSWRNNAWLKKNPWFERELLPYLRKRVRSVLKQ